MSANANDFTWRLEETEVIEQSTRIQGETFMASTTTHPTLMEGSQGDDVVYLQQLLNKKGRATIAVDGDLGVRLNRWWKSISAITDWSLMVLLGKKPGTAWSRKFCFRTFL